MLLLPYYFDTLNRYPRYIKINSLIDWFSKRPNTKTSSINDGECKMTYYTNLTINYNEEFIIYRGSECTISLQYDNKPISGI